MEERVIAIIPARGGSKGIPRKNIAPLCGQPLIAYMIRAALQAECVSRVYVSTDAEDIAAISREHGAEVIPRPAAISGDEASSESALLHALEYLREHDQPIPEVFAFLQCTSPLTTSDDIDGVVRALVDRQADSALAVADFHYFLWKHGADGDEGVNHDKDKPRVRRQDLPPQYVETGSVYAMRTAGFIEAGRRFFGKTVVHATPTERRLEIDKAEDLELAEAVMRLWNLTGDDRELAARASAVKLFVMDVDGVMTDAGMYYSEKGDELKKFNTRDGMAVAMLRRQGIKTAIITSENTEMVARRAQKLKIDHLFQGVWDKATCLEGLIEQLGLTLDEVCFVGDDCNDTKLLARVGLACCPADATPRNQRICHLVTRRAGGQGCIREIVDRLFGAPGQSHCPPPMDNNEHTE